MAHHYGRKIVTDGLILYYDLSNYKSYVSGSNIVYDLSGNNNHGNIQGSIWYDPINNVPLIRTTGSIAGGYINITTPILINNSASYYIESCAYIDSFAGSMAYAIYENGNGNFAKIELAPSRFFGHTNSTASLFMTSIGTGMPGLQTGSFNVVGINNSNGVAYGCINGIHGTNTSSLSGSLNAAVLFKAQAGYSNYRYSFVRIYNRSLSPSEVLQNYNAQKSRFGL